MKKSIRNKNEGRYTIRWNSSGEPYEIDCNDFYVEGGLLVIEHKDEDTEFFPIDRIGCIIKYKNKQEAIPLHSTG